MAYGVHIMAGMTGIPLTANEHSYTFDETKGRKHALAPRSRGEGHLSSASVSRAVTLAKWLDRRFVDPILGFVFPGVGDVVTSTAGLYIVGVAINAGLPFAVIARMLINLAVDALLGSIPLVGDVFDIWFRANKRNVELLTSRHEKKHATASDWLVVIGAGALCLAAISLPFVIMIATLAWIF